MFDFILYLVNGQVLVTDGMYIYDTPFYRQLIAANPDFHTCQGVKYGTTYFGKTSVDLKQDRSELYYNSSDTAVGGKFNFWYEYPCSRGYPQIFQSQPM